MLWPKNRIQQLAEGGDDSVDHHLVFEYNEGDTILDGKYSAPRSNRFYFVHDPNGGRLKQLETYHAL